MSSPSELFERACRTAREDGLRVLTARGSELESSFAFGVVRDVRSRRRLPEKLGAGA